MIDKILAFFGIYYYEFYEGRVYAHFIEEARSKLLNCHSILIETNDPAVV